MGDKLIYGIQQIGIGVDNADHAFEWYGTRLGSDVSIFRDINMATLMAPFMGGQPHQRRAILAINIAGGSGYEFWQYMDRVPSNAKKELEIGDLGINVATVKTRDIIKTRDRLEKMGVRILSEIQIGPDGRECFYIRDPYKNIFRILEFHSWYSNSNKDIGGVCGCTIGIANLERSLPLYSELLEYTSVIFDQTGHFPDLINLPGGQGKFRRILLGHKKNRTGRFSKLFGDSEIELIQTLDRQPKKIFENRYWGDIGFIHLCFDIYNMNALADECETKGFPFKIKSNEQFKMGQANGEWGYIEDPDGTLIEFVETFKVPLIKKLNWYINLRKRDPRKPLPNWLIKAMAFRRVSFAKNHQGNS